MPSQERFPISKPAGTLFLCPSRRLGPVARATVAMSLPNAALKEQGHQSAADDSRPALLWPLPPDAIRIESGQVHLWATGMNDFADQAPALAVLLAPEEQVRAARFKFAEDRNRFVIRQGLLRLILGRYLRLLPSTIQFQQGRYGKPEVRTEAAGGAPLFFNTSHSSEIAVCAITSACPIGVDIERMREIPEIQNIARRFFLPRETRTLMALPADSRLRAFYSCWTRKEAFLKATGEGIAESLAKVEVTLAPDDMPGVVSVAGDLRASEPWQLQPFSPASGYLGCVAYRNTAFALSQWRVARTAM